MPETIETKRFRAGQTIFRQGEHGDVAYVIDEGLVEVSVDTDGESHVLAQRRSGEIIGEMAVVSPRARTATAVALKPTVAKVVPASALSSAVDEISPDFKIAYTAIVQRYREALDRLESDKTHVSSAIKHLAQAEQKVQVTLEASTEFRERFKEISDVSHNISEIALHTNLLAVNASVEASRAGQAGAAFGVVANEVRALAERTKNDAARIDAQVSGLAEKLARLEASLRDAKATLDDGREAAAKSKGMWR